MKLTDIKVDSALQGRVELNQEVVNEYSEILREGVKFPAVKVYRVGSSNLLVDGWHRYFAHKKAGLADIEVETVEGTYRDALYYAITQANKGHGLRLTINDKRKKLMMLLDDVEWAETTDRKIAQLLEVSHTFVGNMRGSLGIKPEVVKVQKGNKEYELKVNKKNDDAPVPPLQKQETYEDEIAAEMEAIVEENEALTRRLAAAAFDASDEEKSLALNKLEEMASEIKTLKAALAAAESQLAIRTNEAAEKSDQVKYWKRRAEKAEKRLETFIVPSV
jgi:ParB-like chromosome segregation protein Spo0J